MEDNSIVTSSPAAQGTQTDILANRETRLIAAIIDVIVVGAIGMVFAMVVHFLFGWLWFFLQSVIIFAGYIGIYFAVNAKLLESNGQTIGKKVMKIKIVMKNGEKASLYRIIVYRMLPIFVLGVIPIIKALTIIDPLLIFRESRFCLHDDIADTKVVVVG